MKTKAKMMTGLALAIGGLLASQYAAATTLQFPDKNVMSVGTYNDFEVYSFDLLEKCASAGDPNCTDYRNFESPQEYSPPTENIGSIADELIIYTGENTPNVENYTKGPLTGDQADVQIDNPFEAPTGTGTTSTFDMIYIGNTGANEPGDAGSKGYVGSDNEFAVDLDARWDAKLSSIVDYLTHPDGTMSDLVFLFGNNADGAGPDQWMYIWAQIEILDAAGDVVDCFELSTHSAYAGCVSTMTGTEPTPLFSGYDGTPASLANLFDPTINEFVPVVGNFCVDGDPTSATYGQSYNIGTASNSGDCNTGDYFVNNNLGNDDGEFAAYIDLLNVNLEDWAAAGYSMSLNLKMRNLTDGDETAWICDNCYLDRPPTYLPGPAPLALIGLGLLGIHMSRRKFTRAS